MNSDPKANKDQNHIDYLYFAEVILNIGQFECNLQNTKSYWYYRLLQNLENAVNLINSRKD